MHGRFCAQTRPGATVPCYPHHPEDMNSAGPGFPRFLAALIAASCLLLSSAQAVHLSAPSRPFPRAELPMRAAAASKRPGYPSRRSAPGRRLHRHGHRSGWPQEHRQLDRTQLVAGTGDRLVAFTLAVTQPQEDAGYLGEILGGGTPRSSRRAVLSVSMDTSTSRSKPDQCDRAHHRDRQLRRLRTGAPAPRSSWC